MPIPIIGQEANKGVAKITPFHDQIMLEAIPASATSAGGIIIPEAHRTAVNQGTVVDKGPLVSENVKLGTILFFPLHSESRLKYKGHDYILVAESSVLGAIEEIKC